MRKFFLFILTLFLCLTFFSSTSLAVMYPLSIKQLSADSNMIIIGEVVETKSMWDTDRALIFTRATIKPLQVITGKTERGVIEVEYPGGRVAEMGMGVSDQPRLTPSERVLLFLKKRKVI